MSTASQPLLPRDARLIALLLAANGAEDCEEGVVRMLVEFAHRYTSDVLSDSLLYAEHARTTTSNVAAQNLVPSLDDVRIAVQARTEGASIPKEFLLGLASTVNAVPLPPVPEVYGIRLPPPSSRLTAPNFSLVPRSSTAAPPTVASGNESDEGLFGDDIEGEDDDEEEEEEEEEDEEMEDVTAGIGGGGNMEGGGGGKRKASDDEDYD